MAGIYIHIPFCKQACHYCDFHFSTNLGKQTEMLHALCTEIGLRKDYIQGEKIESIYFGGGTPSLLSVHELTLLFSALRQNFSIALAAEVTLEANPDDLSMQKLQQLREAGINRLSIGIQSFDDAILRSLNRVHDSRLAKECIDNAYAAGFENISIDLIYAIPGQDDEQWKKNIDEALQFRPKHISSYSLTIEEKTVFGRQAARGKFTAVDDDRSAAQLQMLAEMLTTAGYEHYEVSNFCQPGFISRHNSNYWKNKIYLGIGPSAHSFNEASRQYNVSSNHQYLADLHLQRVPATVEILSQEDKINEYLLTSLRTSWGVNLQKLRDDFGVDLYANHRTYINLLQTNELGVVHEDTLVLTRKGKLLADKIASDLFVTP